jgi:hypothetical protein
MPPFTGRRRGGSFEVVAEDRALPSRARCAITCLGRNSACLLPCSPTTRVSGRQRDQDRLRHPAGAANPEFRRQLERGADRSAAVAYYDAKNHQRSLEVMRWGLIPFWAKDEKIEAVRDPGVRPSARI